MPTAAPSGSDIGYATATELARRICDREISSAEVTRTFLARIAAHNGKLNAIVHLLEQEAVSRAREADEALARGRSWGALHGVPLTVKEAILVANTPSTMNSNRLKNYIASEDASIVQRVRAAGAVILGKTNVPAELRGYQVEGDIYPVGKNPYRLECSPGGSTGGRRGGGRCRHDGAGARDRWRRIAAGPRALLRGLLPQADRQDSSAIREVPMPQEARGFRVNLVQPGPLGRSIEDLELLWEILRGPDPSDFEIARIAWRPPSGRSLEQLRFAWTDGFQEYVAGGETREQLAALVARIERAGARVEKAAPAIYPRAREVFVQLLAALLGQDMPWPMRKIFPLFAARGLLKGQPHMVKLLRRALEMNTQEYAAALGVKRELVEDIERFFGDHDVLLAPVSFGPAFRRCEEGSALDFDGATRPYNDYCWPYVAPFNASGHPALVMPLGTSKEELPIGVQLIGPYWSEPELLHIARQLAPLTEGCVPPKGF